MGSSQPCRVGFTLDAGRRERFEVVRLHGHALELRAAIIRGSCNISFRCGCSRRTLSASPSSHPRVIHRRLAHDDALMQSLVATRLPFCLRDFRTVQYAFSWRSDDGARHECSKTHHSVLAAGGSSATHVVDHAVTPLHIMLEIFFPPGSA